MISSIPSEYYNQGEYISYNQTQVPSQSIVRYVANTRRSRASDFFGDYRQYKEKGEITDNDLNMEKKLEDVKKMNIELERKLKDLKESINNSRDRSRSYSRDRYSRRYSYNRSRSRSRERYSRDRSRSRSRDHYSQRYSRDRSRDRYSQQYSRDCYDRKYEYKQIRHKNSSQNYKVTPCKYGHNCKHRYNYINGEGEDCSFFHEGDTPKQRTSIEVAIKWYKINN